MRLRRASYAHLILSLVAALGISQAGTPAQAQSNLLTNGGFENDAEGTTWVSPTPSSSWRFYAFGGAVGSATVRAAAASEGSRGLELVHNTPAAGDTAFDKGWANPDIMPRVPAEQRVYKALVDVKDGGALGSSNNFLMQLYLQWGGDLVGFVNPTSTSIDPAAAFETVGVAGLSDNLGKADIRLITEIGTSVYLDNARLYDVTSEANRLVNGGFENSATRVLNFSLFSNTPGECTMALNNDAHGGNNALLIARNGVTADGGFGHGGTEVPTIGGERLRITTWAKKASGDASTRLWVGVIEHDGSNWTYQHYAAFNPGGSYTKCVSDILLRADTKTVYFNFRIGDNNADSVHVGSYLIDDLDVRRPTNMIADGDFEAEADGDALVANRAIYANLTPPVSLLDLTSNWRLFDSASGSGSATFRAAAASQGSTGLEIVRETMAADALVDRGWGNDAICVQIPASVNVYKLLVDAKDGGVYGGTTNFSLPLSTWNTALGDFKMYPKSFDPAAQFETIGVAGASDGSGTKLDVRMQPNVAASSAFVDNVRVYDVTRGDRLSNGGFENSPTRVLNWRTWGVMSATLDADAHTGAHATRLETSDGTSDGGMDLMADLVPVVVGETLNLSAFAKKVAGDSDTRLMIQLHEMDGAQTWPPLRTTTILANPGTAAYEALAGAVTIGAGAAYVNVMVRVGDSAAYDRHLGAYLLDDVRLMRDNAPTFTGAALAYNAADAAWHVTTTGWSDVDGDAENYQYQWLLDGTPIAGATRATLTYSEIAAPGSLTCVVTPDDGIAQGAAITTAAVATVPVELSAFGIE